MKLFYLKKDVENNVAIKEQKQLSQVKGERHYRKLPLKSTGLRDYKRVGIILVEGYESVEKFVISVFKST